MAFFGQKDAQQALVIRRLVSDLNLPVRVRVLPTVREADGLAMSSRNVRLTAGERLQAASLHRSLERAQAVIGTGQRDPAAVRSAALAELDAAGVAPEYLELVAPDTFETVQHVDRDVLALVAARVGGTRLIDNQLLRVPTDAEQAHTHNGRH
ncbi:MAG: pantoate--beta-alanine ligase [Solirubrobacterales bacterium]|nr:pantoate--beta-alanine ligase [Solirubrobacterales bacterium]